jgi:hypothetical protein
MKVISKPIKVSFYTKEGKFVSFKALRTMKFKKPLKVNFLRRGKK